MNGNKDDTSAGLPCQKWPKKGGVSKQLRAGSQFIHKGRATAALRSATGRQIRKQVMAKKL